jgi:hypothetical protein
MHLLIRLLPAGILLLGSPAPSPAPPVLAPGAPDAIGASTARPGPPAATGVAPDCPVPCQGSIACRLCAVKLELYRGWMDEVGRGVELHPLPAATIATLAPHFPGVDLEVVRVGHTAMQLADGLTDCDRIYLAGAELAEAVRSGTSLAPLEMEFFLHELVHVEQCAGLGGRDAYALLWFRDVGVGALTLLLTGGHWMGLHGAMPMEEEAARRAAEIREALESTGSSMAPPATGP